MGLPEPEGPISRMLDFSIDHIPEVGVGDDRIGSVTVPGIDETLEVVGDAEGEPPLGDFLPDDDTGRGGQPGTWGMGSTRGVPHFEGRSGGGAGSGLAGAVICDDCLGGARAADAGSRLEAALKERDARGRSRKSSGQVGHRAWGHQGRRRTATTTMAVERPLRRCQVCNRKLCQLLVMSLRHCRIQVAAGTHHSACSEVTQ